MSENNETWRVVTSEPCIGIWQDDYCIADLTDMNIPWEDKVAIAHRMCLEHEACAGMSDDCIGQGLISIDATLAPDARAQALKFDLDEARKVIRELQGVAGQSSPYHNDLANDFLIRTEDK